MEWKDIVAVALATVTTVFTAYKVYSERRKDKPEIKVEITTNIIGTVNDSNLMVVLNALNIGHKPVTLAVMGFLLPDGKILDFIRPQSNVNFPYRLEPNDSCKAWMEIGRFKAALMKQGYYGKVKLVGYYRDQVNRAYKSKKWIFDTDMW